VKSLLSWFILIVSIAVLVSSCSSSEDIIPETTDNSSTTADTTAPSVSSFTLSDTALITGDTATVTLVFSEAVASFSSSADITVANGTLAVMTSTDNITWAGTFTPTANTEDASNTLSLATSYTDTAGNAGASATTANYAVETQAPTVSSVSTTADNQSLVSITDNITVTFSEAMDNTSVTTNTDNTTCYGTLRVTSDNFSSCVQMSSSSPESSDNITFTLDPSDNLTGGTTYLTRVTTGVKDAAGNAMSSQYDNSTGFATLLTAPDNLSASGANNTITLTWNSVSGATSYTLYWDNASGIDSSDNVIDNITNVNYTHSSLSDGTYYYKVAAVNSSGTGTLSSVASALLSASILGSETYNAHTYAITSAPMTFAEAKAAAAAVGGYLTTVNTKAENTFLTNKFYAAYGNKALWIGANDIATEATWIWDNGTTSGDDNLTDTICNAPSGNCRPSNATWADGSRKWNNGEPNNSGNEDCANITRSDGTWNDLRCTRNQYGIIEFD